jgi:CDP-diacylglycerol--glycerol-3-phosphate 3-phosphatidyltransferase
MNIKNLNIPLLLTLIRLIFSPLILPLLLVSLLPYNIFMVNAGLAALFAGFSLTDFFDGYLARKYQQETSLGRVLDPIADKFLLFSVLIALLAAHKIYFYWVILLIGREFFVTGLRAVALENNFSLVVSAFGKIKTTLQALCLTWIILNPYQQLGFSQAPLWNGIEISLLVITTLLSVFSAWLYYRIFMNFFLMRGGIYK